jgi:hypothetical protein
MNNNKVQLTSTDYSNLRVLVIGMKHELEHRIDRAIANSDKAGTIKYVRDLDYYTNLLSNMQGL